MGVQLVSNNRNNNSNRRSGNSRNDQPSEFEGIWLNIGVMTGDENDPENQRFLRLPRGVAIEDLQTRRVYDTMDPDFAEDVHTTNNLIKTLQELGLELEEGESMNLNLSVQIYRRQEAQEDAGPTKEDRKALRAALLA
jgi:hypothetical protein